MVWQAQKIKLTPGEKKKPRTPEQYRKDATEAHDKIIKELEEDRAWVSDDSARESARRKLSVLNNDLKQLEKDIKHYLPANCESTILIWRGMHLLKVGIEAVVSQEESHITY